MLPTLIVSKTRVKILTLFLTHSGKRFYYTEIIRRLKITPSAAQKELAKLEKIGLLKSTKEAGIRYYKVVEDFPLYTELKNIIFKTVGLAEEIKQNLSKIGNLEFAFIYGSVAKNTEDVRSDIDLMILGDPDMDELTKTITKTEEVLSREINFTVYDLKEWRKNLRQKKAFATNVYKDKKIFLIGSENELRKLS